MFKKLARSIRQYKKETILTPVCMFGEVVLECIIPLVMAKIVDAMDGGTMKEISYYGLILFVLAMCSLACGVGSGIFAATASTGFAKNMRRDVFYKVQDFTFADIDYFSSSSLVTRMTTDITNIQNAFQMLLRMGVRAPFMILFSVLMTVSVHAGMSLIFLGLIPVLAGVLFGVFFKVHPIFKRIFKRYDAMNNSVQENIAGVRVVKSFVREDYEDKKFKEVSGQVKDDFTRAEKILALNSPTMTFAMYAAMLMVAYFGARLIVSSNQVALSTGDLTSLLTYGVQILSSVMMLSMVFVMGSMAMESAERVVEVLDYEPSMKLAEEGKTQVANGEISFEHVSFKYSNRSKRNALEDINIRIPSGSTLGIIGGTGSAKTSLIQLIPRLYDVTEGAVKVGGVDVREYDLETLRDAVAVVLQKNVLFSGTIKENLRWGKEDATDEEIEEVCKLACADEFIEQFPHKYDTYIEQGGTNVSGGQKQRLCIARALLKAPKVLILDDSTSAVDTKTDAMIRHAMATRLPETTKIIIAQRVSSVQDADQIIVLDGGKVVEQGNHQELVAKKGIYAEIFETQTKSKEVAE